VAFLFFKDREVPNRTNRERTRKNAGGKTMAKINTANIEGYANMTAEEKLAALEALEMPEPDYSGWVKKDVADKYASEAAGYKKQLRERMSADEADKAKAAEDLAAVMEELELLRTEKVVTENTNKFLGLGYDEKLARETATALNKGEMDVVFKNHAKFLESREKQLRAEILRETPSPAAGVVETTMKKSDFNKMTLAEKAKFAQENPEQFKELYGGN
jgi:hypothetical protein